MFLYERWNVICTMQHQIRSHFDWAVAFPIPMEEARAVKPLLGLMSEAEVSRWTSELTDKILTNFKLLAKRPLAPNTTHSLFPMT